MTVWGRAFHCVHLFAYVYSPFSTLSNSQCIWSVIVIALRSRLVVCELMGIVRQSLSYIISLPGKHIKFISEMPPSQKKFLYDFKYVLYFSAPETGINPLLLYSFCPRTPLITTGRNVMNMIRVSYWINWRNPNRRTRLSRRQANWWKCLNVCLTFLVD